MLKFLAVIKKEFLLLERDIPGLGVLFLMPMILVLVVTIVQDSAFKAVQEPIVSLVLVNQDDSFFGAGIEKGLKNTPFFSVTGELDGIPATEKTARNGVMKGEYQVGVIIPKGASTQIKKAVLARIRDIFANNGLAGTGATGKKTGRISAKPVRIITCFDPQIRASVKNAVLSSLNNQVSRIETYALTETFGRMIKDFIPNTNFASSNKTQNKNSFSPETKPELVTFKEVFGIEDHNLSMPTSVQQNVPAWTMFAMFFIAVPLASSLIKERNDGIASRLKTLPVSEVILVMGKSMVYLCVCMLQFGLMMMVGIFILPLLGTPVLETGASPTGLGLVALTSALAAIGFGILVGNIASTHEQASMFSSVAIVVAAALGGVMVPVFAMPIVMQKISALSPLAWGLDAFLDIFLRDGTVGTIIPNALALCGFAFFTAMLGLFYRNLRN